MAREPGRTTQIRSRKTGVSPKGGGTGDSLTRFLRGDDGKPSDVTVEVIKYDPEALIKHKIQTSSDFDAWDFFMPLAIMLVTFAVGASGMVFGLLSWVAVIMLQLYILYDLLARIRRKPSGRLVVGMTPPYPEYGWKWSVLVYLGTAPAIFGIVLLNQILAQRFFPRLAPFKEPQTASMGGFLFVLMSIGLFALLMEFLTVVVLAPVYEELWFRGVGLAGFMKHYSPIRAVLVTSLIFGLLHGPGRMLFTGLFGLVLAFIRFRTGSIYCCIAIHALHNFLVVALNILYAVFYFAR